MALMDDTARAQPAEGAQPLRPPVTGEYCCASCGQRTIVAAPPLPHCPVCDADAWRLVAWRPFSGHARAELPPGQVRAGAAVPPPPGSR